MAAQLDIVVARNETWGRSFQLCDGEGNPFDVTGASLEGEIKSRIDNSVTIASFDCSIADAAQGIFSVSLDASEGTTLNTYGSPIQTDNLKYDIRAVDAGGIKRRLVYGTVILQRGVTQNG